MGSELNAFEESLAEICRSKYAVGCASGLDALEISLRIAGVTRGDKVLTTPLSAFATTLAIIRTGGVPVFSDVDYSGLIDLGMCRDILDSDSTIKYFLPVHLYGHCVDLMDLQDLCVMYKLIMIEDCAQSILARSKNQLCGTVGHSGALSFYPTKNLACLGDGGAIITQSEDTAVRATQMRDYGQSGKFVHSVIGMNSRLDTLQAMFLKDVLMPRLEDLTLKRREIAEYYQKHISHPDISISIPKDTTGSVWHLFPVMINENRESFLEHMLNRAILCGIHYPTPIPEQPVIAGDSICPGGIANAISICQREVSLPIHPFLRDDDRDRIVAACNSWPI